MEEYRLYLIGQSFGKVGEFEYRFDGLKLSVGRYGKIHRCDAFYGDCFAVFDCDGDFALARVGVPMQTASLAMWMCGFEPEQCFRSKEEFHSLVNERRGKTGYTQERESRVLRHSSAFIVHYGKGRYERVAAYLAYGVVHEEIVAFLVRYHQRRYFIVPDEYAVWLMENRLFCTQDEIDAVMDRHLSLLREEAVS